MKLVTVVTANSKAVLEKKIERQIRKGYTIEGSPFTKDGSLNQLMTKNRYNGLKRD